MLKSIFLLKFQLTAARRRLVKIKSQVQTYVLFQLTAARRRLALPPNKPLRDKPFQLTAARRRLGRWARIKEL